MICLRVLSGRYLTYPSHHSSPNSRPFNHLQPLCRYSVAPLLCFQQLAASFPKIPGWGGDHSVPSEFRPRRSLCCAFSRLRARNPFASYHIPVNPAVSGNYTLFCATARRYPSCNQEVAHSFHRHGVAPLPLSRVTIHGPRLSRLIPKALAGGNTACP
jgi:hypothetical protein